MAGVGRDFCGSSSPPPLPNQGHLQQAAQDLVQVDFEYLQRRSLHNLPGQPVAVLRRPQNGSLLQAEQPQLSQPALIREILQSSGHFRGPPLDLLQHIHVLLMWGAPELETVLQVGSHESRVKG